MKADPKPQKRLLQALLRGEATLEDLKPAAYEIIIHPEPAGEATYLRNGKPIPQAQFERETVGQIDTILIDFVDDPQ